MFAGCEMHLDRHPETVEYYLLESYRESKSALTLCTPEICTPLHCMLLKIKGLSRFMTSFNLDVSVWLSV